MKLKEPSRKESERNFAMNRNFQLLNRGIEYALEKGSFSKLNLISRAQHVCVFGLGRYFREAFVTKKIKERFNVDILCDNNPEKWGKEYEGLPCVSPEELKNYKNLVVIIMVGEAEAIKRQLSELGILWMTHIELALEYDIGLSSEDSWFRGETEKIKEAFTLLADEESKRIYANALCNRIAYPIADYGWQDLYVGNEYFGQSFMKLGINENFVDCGAFDGDTVLDFMKAVPEYQSIHAFEIDKYNFEQMKSRVGNRKNIFLYNKGVWDENKYICYGVASNEPREGVSIYKTEGIEQHKCEVVRLDDEMKDKPVSFIKMDIEGAEIHALKGAECLIREHRPQIAVCVYHRISDFWDIPLLLKEYCKDYRLYLRHHYEKGCYGTVLYACGAADV